MNNSGLKILAALFIILLAAVLLRGRAGRKGPEPLFEGLSVKLLDISSRGSRALLELKEGAWYQGRWPADEEKMRKALKGLASIRLDELISSNSLKHGDFEVNESSAAIVRAVADTGEENVLFIGKHSGEWTRSYIRMGDSEKVYIISGVSREMFGAQEESWRKKDIIDLDDALRIRIDSPAGSYDISKGTGTWQLLAEELAALRATGFIEDTGKYSSYMEQPLFKIEITDSADFSRTCMLISDGVESMILSGDLLYRVKRDAPEKLSAALSGREEESEVKNRKDQEEKK